ncbi:MAG: regulatory protein RecX [Clostridia bacterium]|nr:regulatory protein RecX [Clostridia bacterium]
MKITEVAVRRRRLYLLRLEDGREMPVDRQTFDESGYAVGGDLTEEQLESLLALSGYNRARERALYLLGLRDYACKELEQKLHTEADPETAAAVVERLRQVGLLDDRRYAHRLAKSLTEYKQYPRRRVEQELRRRGVDPLTVQEAVAALDGEDFQQALALIEKKYYNKINTAEDRQRVTAALARRGFSYGAIRRAMDEYGAPEDDSEETEEWL